MRSNTNASRIGVSSASSAGNSTKPSRGAPGAGQPKRARAPALSCYQCCCHSCCSISAGKHFTTPRSRNWGQARCSQLQPASGRRTAGERASRWRKPRRNGPQGGRDSSGGIRPGCNALAPTLGQRRPRGFTALFSGRARAASAQGLTTQGRGNRRKLQTRQVLPAAFLPMGVFTRRRRLRRYGRSAGG